MRVPFETCVRTLGLKFCNFKLVPTEPVCSQRAILISSGRSETSGGGLSAHLTLGSSTKREGVNYFVGPGVQTLSSKINL